MKKTALQLLIDWMEQNQYFIGNDLYAKQKELLETEREQIEEHKRIREAAERVVVEFSEYKTKAQGTDKCGAIIELEKALK
jgi:uncharacterized protein with von Willebrand factor type A (vWA) domain